MKKKLIFLINGVQIDQVDDKELKIDEVGDFKRGLAIIHSVKTHDIEVIAVDVVVRDESKVLTCNGKGFEFKPNEYALNRSISGIECPFDPSTEQGLNDLLDALKTQSLDSLLTFI